MKAFQFIFISILLLMSNFCIGQSSQLKNIAISKPKIKATESYTKGNKYLQYVMQDIISESQGLVNFIDRNGMEDINTLRSKGDQNLESNIGTTEMEGVEYLIETKLLNYRESWKNYCDVVSKEYREKDGRIKTKKISEDCRNSSIQLNFDLQVNLVSVETGEVISKREFSPSAWSYGDYIKEPSADDKTRMRILAYDDMKECFRVLWKQNLLKLLDPQIEVLGISDYGSKKANKIYISGGQNALFPSNVKMDVLKKYTENIGGETIERSEKIGEMMIEQQYHQYSICKVKKGKKEIYEALESDTELVCTAGEMRIYETCGTQPARAKMMADIKGTSELIKLEVPVESSSEKTSTTKSTAPARSSNTPTTIRSTSTKRTSSPRSSGGGQTSSRSSNSSSSKSKTTKKKAPIKTEKGEPTPIKTEKGGGNQY